MASLPTTRRGHETRIRIVDAAASLIALKGVASTSLADVEAASGVGRSQLYHYFDDRDDLLRAVVVSTGGMLASNTSVLLEGGGLAALDRWFASAVEANELAEGARGCPLGSLVGQLAEHDDVTRGFLGQSFDDWERPLQSLLEGMRTEGTLAPTSDPAILADQVMALMQGGLVLAQAHHDPARLVRALDAARQLVLAA